MADRDWEELAKEELHRLGFTQMPEFLEGKAAVQSALDRQHGLMAVLPTPCTVRATYPHIRHEVLQLDQQDALWVQTEMLNSGDLGLFRSPTEAWFQLPKEEQAKRARSAARCIVKTNPEYRHAPAEIFFGVPAAGTLLQLATGSEPGRDKLRIDKEVNALTEALFQPETEWGQTEGSAVPALLIGGALALLVLGAVARRTSRIEGY
ncbi:MAG: hypothetical protein Q8R28_01845 [Dehalococcoidia bacterium]|nr:hypothetical protein [Dehalococcoidia bacterium]